MALYAWGCNKFGELGLEEQNSVWTPQNVSLADNGQLPVSIAAGEGHSLFATDSGDVYCFGRGREGQLGLGNERRNVDKPTLLRDLQHESVIKVATGAISRYDYHKSPNST
jgi:alpha-tubulin suppressor-like RCC1 family protein